jgi:hypothetical protein
MMMYITPEQSKAFLNLSPRVRTHFYKGKDAEALYDKHQDTDAIRLANNWGITQVATVYLKQLSWRNPTFFVFLLDHTDCVEAIGFSGSSEHAKQYADVLFDLCKKKLELEEVSFDELIETELTDDFFDLDAELVDYDPDVHGWVEGAPVEEEYRFDADRGDYDDPGDDPDDEEDDDGDLY